jgi:hypothetical protein
MKFDINMFFHITKMKGWVIIQNNNTNNCDVLTAIQIKLDTRMNGMWFQDSVIVN